MYFIQFYYIHEDRGRFGFLYLMNIIIVDERGKPVWCAIIIGNMGCRLHIRALHTHAASIANHQSPTALYSCTLYVHLLRKQDVLLKQIKLYIRYVQICSSEGLTSRLLVDGAWNA